MIPHPSLPPFSPRSGSCWGRARPSRATAHSYGRLPVPAGLLRRINNVWWCLDRAQQAGLHAASRISSLGRQLEAAIRHFCQGRRLEAARAAREQPWGQARQEGTLEEHPGSILTTLPSHGPGGFPFLHQNGPKNPSLWGRRISISGKLTLVASSPWISPGPAAVWGFGPGRVKPNPLN